MDFVMRRSSGVSRYELEDRETFSFGPKGDCTSSTTTRNSVRATWFGMASPSVTRSEEASREKAL